MVYNEKGSCNFFELKNIMNRAELNIPEAKVDQDAVDSVIAKLTSDCKNYGALPLVSGF